MKRKRAKVQVFDASQSIASFHCKLFYSIDSHNSWSASKILSHLQHLIFIWISHSGFSSGHSPPPSPLQLRERTQQWSVMLIVICVACRHQSWWLIGTFFFALIANVTKANTFALCRVQFVVIHDKYACTLWNWHSTRWMFWHRFLRSNLWLIGFVCCGRERKSTMMSSRKQLTNECARYVKCIINLLLMFGIVNACQPQFLAIHILTHSIVIQFLLFPMLRNSIWISHTTN